MAYKVRCTSCGKSMRLPDYDAGLAVVCLACGTKFIAPAMGAGDAPGASVPVRTPLDAVSISTIAEPPVPEVAPAPVSAPDTRRRVPILWMLATCFVLLVAGGIVLVGYQWSAKRSGVAELTEMQTAAAEKRKKGDLEGAYQVYRDLDRRATEIGTSDPDTRKIADQARAEQEAIYAVLLSRQPPAPPATAPLPPPQPQTKPVQEESVIAIAPPRDETASPTTTSRPYKIAATEELDPAAIVVARPATVPSGPASRPTPRRLIASTRPPKLHPVPETATGITDEEIGHAIERAVEAMIARFDPKTGQLKELVGSTESYACGLNALCVYSLLQSSQAIADPRLNVRGPYMKSLIEGMKKLQANEGPATYARGIRATALALFDRKEDRSALRADMTYLLLTQTDGAYTYAGQRASNGFKPSVSWDNSNSQYGLLGVWSGAEVGLEVPTKYWGAVQKHWTVNQNRDGTWAYVRGPGTTSMTAAGTASLFVADDYLNADKFGARVGREPFSPPLKKALDWWETGNSLSFPTTSYWGYTLYGIERVGLASGFKYFGKHDWYRSLAYELVKRQGPDGFWENSVVDSAYSLLFLARGRHPILMNKLRFDRGGLEGDSPGYWGNRPRDAANLARYAGKRLERPLNWQVVNLDRDWTDWLDSPILSIASHRAPFFTDADCDKFRNYAEAGGMIYLQADGGSQEFDAFATRFASRVFPGRELQTLPPNHLIYSTLYKSDASPLKAVTNGSRLLLLYSPADLSKAWQVRDETSKEGAFKLGTNLFVYAAGKRELRNRLSSAYVSAPTTPPPLGTVNVARIRYTGNWDPEPGAWRRFANVMHRQTGTGVAVAAVPLVQLKPGSAAIAHLTGTAVVSFQPEQLQALKAFVDAGGVLLIDSTGGQPEFTKSMKEMLAAAFPEQRLKPLPKDHPLLLSGQPGMEDLTKPRLRPFVAEQGGAAMAALQILRSGKGVVILSPLDLTTGLLDTQTWGIFGYEPAYAEGFMRNLLFWTLDGKQD